MGSTWGVPPSRRAQTTAQRSLAHIDPLARRTLPARSAETRLPTMSSSRVMSELRRHWVRPEIYPVVAATIAGLTLCGGIVTRHLTRHPDIVCNRHNPFPYLNIEDGDIPKLMKVTKRYE